MATTNEILNNGLDFLIVYNNYSVNRQKAKLILLKQPNNIK